MGNKILYFARNHTLLFTIFVAFPIVLISTIILEKVTHTIPVILSLMFMVTARNGGIILVAYLGYSALFDKEAFTQSWWKTFAIACMVGVVIALVFA
jgi:hypothetical protein